MREKLTYANVVSTIALFAVIAGGTAVALPGKKTVQANDLKKNAVKAAAIAKGAVGASEIAEGAVGSSEILDASVAGADVADRSLGYEDLGSNSVVTRIRSTGPIGTGDGGLANPVSVPLSGNTWTQAANELDVAFGEATYTQPATCGGNGDMRIEFLLGGEVVDADNVGDSTAPGQTLKELVLVSRPYLFEPGADTQRTLTMRASDDCSGAGENFTLNSVAGNVIGTR
jgi:hypothetical protein